MLQLETLVVGNDRIGLSIKELRNRKYKITVAVLFWNNIREARKKLD